MKYRDGAGRKWVLAATFAVVLVTSTMMPSRLAAQDYPTTMEGETAIWQSQTANINSLATVDANQFYTNDICSTINTILTSPSEFKCGGQNPKGVVIDARGITGSPLTCSVNPFNGSNCGNQVTIDGEKLTAIVLLPAATIRTQVPWILPKNAKVIGEGTNLTTLQVCTIANCGVAFSQGTDTVQMGSTVCPGNYGIDCPGVGIEHLTIDAQNNPSVNGIHNVYGQELSYVNDVAINNIGSNGIGLVVDSTAGNSGPYSNIYVSSTSSNATCAWLKGQSSPTRGVHGLTCNGSGSTNAAILLDGRNNSIEDVYITGGYTNGILVGANYAAQNNILFNINGGGSVTNVVNISNNSSNVGDLTIMGVTSSTAPSSLTIADNLTGTFLHDGSVGMYVLGESVTGTSGSVGYSRFTTSPSIPAWFVGNGAPSSGCSTGALYSDTSGTANSTLYACVNGHWQAVK